MVKRRGRRGSKRARERQARLAEKLYAPSPAPDVRPDDGEDWAAVELKRLRSEAREIIQRNPGSARMWRVAADFLLKAARLEQAMKGTSGAQQKAAVMRTFEHLDGQLNPERWRFEEKDPDRLPPVGEPEMAVGEE